MVRPVTMSTAAAPPATAPSIEKLTTAREREATRSLVPLFATGVCIWAIDFKAESSGKAAAFQAVILGVYLLTYAQVTLTAAKRGATLGSYWTLIIATAIFVVAGAVMGLTEGQVPYDVLVNVISPFVYISAGAFTVLTLRASANDSSTFLKVIQHACLWFAIVHIIVLLLNKGSINFKTARFEVLSGAVIPSLGIAAVALVQRASRLDLAALMFNLMVTLLSVTRTLFVVMAAQIAAIFMALPSAVFRKAAIRGGSAFLALVLVVGAIDLAAGTGLIGRWTDRMTVSSRSGGYDPTSLTRSAETYWMMQKFKSSTRSMMLGHGMAAETSLSGPDAQRAASIVGKSTVYIHGKGFGHQAYASILFISGLVGGGILLFMQFFNGAQAIALLRRIQQAPPESLGTAHHIGAWGAIIVVGMLAFGFWAGTLGDRATCLWYGIGTGMLYWAREVIPVTKPSLRRPLPPRPAGFRPAVPRAAGPAAMQDPAKPAARR